MRREHRYASARAWGVMLAIAGSALAASPAQAAGPSFDLTPGPTGGVVTVDHSQTFDYGSTRPPVSVVVQVHNGGPECLFTAQGDNGVIDKHDTGGSVGWNPTPGTFTDPPPLTYPLAAPATLTLTLSCGQAGTIQAIAKDELPPPPAPTPSATLTVSPTESSLRTAVTSGRTTPSTAPAIAATGKAASASTTKVHPVPSSVSASVLVPPAVVGPTPSPNANPMSTPSRSPTPLASVRAAPPRLKGSPVAASRVRKARGGISPLLVGVLAVAGLAAATGLLAVRRQSTRAVKEVA